ncbi:MAG TPA: bifunctional 2-C-methyl-D-erythritol 4-phosphate cytidylyltransferase/2-C-methyl-D-erythritol 2,4-cyclodiphosphate synthase [Alphaproteobacteria bacterium]|jgi:2-C-methyl-D-erythritol 4-phosphate cytidylyltransferase/2-C-methyl-D-erythritol 2,4-cyclodiphosphate synthase
MEISASDIPATPFYAVIAAGGSGSRLGGDVPKQYVKIGGKAILRRTVEAFLACPGLNGLVVVIDPAYRSLYEEAVKGLILRPFVASGTERKSSVYNGLLSFSDIADSDVVLIHDAARPFIDPVQIASVVHTACDHQAATLAIPVSDTPYHADNNNYVNRNGLWAIQTPQAFHYGLIMKAHAQAGEYTDDSSLVAALGHEIKLVPGSRENFKITTMDDLQMAQKLLPRSTRTGMGFDVHAFTAGNKVRMCGVDIPHTHALAGHSDADAGLHALTDALLGAIAAGDIGKHFPPSDPKWKGVDSAVFLRHAVEMVHARGGEITNLDLTIICEAPKIGPHREEMQARIAEICGITPGQVGIKATTTEGLGFTGRGEGIAAQAVVTILFAD